MMIIESVTVASFKQKAENDLMVEMEMVMNSKHWTEVSYVLMVYLAGLLSRDHPAL